MRIRALEKFQSRGYSLEAEDTVTVSDEDGAHFCAHGWAEDVSGSVQTGPRIPGVSTLDLPNATHSHTGA